MQLHKKIFIVALVLSICISLYFLINPSNISHLSDLCAVHLMTPHLNITCL